MMKKKLFLFIFPILAVMLFFALSANATLIESGLPGGGPPNPDGSPTGLQPRNSATIITPAQYVRYLYLFVMGFVGIAGLVTLVIWGTVWTASGVVDKKAAAMEGIKNTLYGIGVALSAYILLYTINPDLTVIKTPTLTKIDTNIKTTAAPGCIATVTRGKECQWVGVYENAPPETCTDRMKQPAIKADTTTCTGTKPMAEDAQRPFDHYTCCVILK